MPISTSFFMAGFECSTHRRIDGRRLDLIAGTQHDRFALADYARCRDAGLLTVRDGIRWHLIEPRAGHYDFSSVLPQMAAVRQTGVQVIWDLFHYGWPDDLDFFAPAFVTRFADLARAFARLVVEETGQAPMVVPVNEISFVAWGAGEEGFLNPFAVGRNREIKAQLVRAAIAAIESVWDVAPHARIVHTDPLINIIADPEKPGEHETARCAHLAQYESWDMLAGYQRPELGGQPRYLDILGLNHFPWNQWICGGPEVKLGHPLHRPVRHLLAEVHDRYKRPLLLTEVSTEGDGRTPWFRYKLARPVRRSGPGYRWPAFACTLWLTTPAGKMTAIAQPVCGDTPTPRARPVYVPLAGELRRQQRLFENTQALSVDTPLQAVPR